ncbi:MAG: hypothetical protein JSV62_06605 [Promethearchaeota archaeon]|nr:MAG: hypothetical protein JSV62_06605 [Candidatus Lokiarchaeota archaeon]
MNHNVSKITQDLVIFLGGAECAISNEMGTFYYLFGLGYYYIKFELHSGRYITDNRQLTGLILSDFVYDHLATSINITLENDRDVIVGEKLFKAPIDMSFKSDNKITFIQGTLMRNLFIPYKDIFLEYIELLRDPKSYQIDKNGHMILSTTWDSYNKIMISGDMEYESKTKYLEATAGLFGINLGADKHLNKNFTPTELQNIRDIIVRLKNVYSSIEYDSMFLFSIIEKSAPFLSSTKPFTFNLEGNHMNKKMPKESIFISAENRMNDFKEWPLQLKRQTKEELERTGIAIKPKLYQAQQPETLEKPAVIKHIKKEESFELRTMKRPFIETKPLPYIPHENPLESLVSLKKIVEENYDIQTIGSAFEIARNNIKKHVLHANYLWELSKYVNVYKKAEPNLGLSSKEKIELLRDIDNWIKITIQKFGNLKESQKLF